VFQIEPVCVSVVFHVRLIILDMVFFPVVGRELGCPLVDFLIEAIG
jgi:hypothetical protein